MRRKFYTLTCGILPRLGFELALSPWLAERLIWYVLTYWDGIIKQISKSYELLHNIMSVNLEFTLTGMVRKGVWDGWWGERPAQDPWYGHSDYLFLFIFFKNNWKEPRYVSTFVWSIDHLWLSIISSSLLQYLCISKSLLQYVCISKFMEFFQTRACCLVTVAAATFEKIL